MKKLIFTILLLLICSMLLLNKEVDAETASIKLSAEVLPAIAMMVDSSAISFGTVIAGNVSYGDRSIDIIVGTNSANGYQLAIGDGQAGSASSMLNQGDMSTRIADYGSSIGSPKPYEEGDKGVGFTLFNASTNKEAVWGSGNTFNSINNAYAGIPGDATVFHQSPGYKSYNDHSFIGFLLDVPASQKSGSYSGDVVLSATCMLE